MSGFAVWAQSPAGTLALTGCGLVVGMILGYLTGWRVGWRAAVAEMRQRREERAAVRQVRQWREPMWEYRAQNRALAGLVVQAPEVAHEWEPAHVGQALQVANGDPITTGEIQAITPRMDAFLQELFRVPYSADELWSGQ